MEDDAVPFVREPRIAATAKAANGNTKSPFKKLLLRATLASGVVFALLLLCRLMFHRKTGSTINEHGVMSSIALVEPGSHSELVHFSIRGGAKPNNEEWKVIPNIVHVRNKSSVSSSCVAMKQSGQILIADQSVNNWVKLRHEPGWVEVSAGSTPLLQRRSVTYLQLVIGSCADSGNFPVTEKAACIAAAGALGHHVQKLRSYKGKDPRPEGCYVQGSEIWMEASIRNRGRGASSATEQLCSSSKYATISDGYMDQQDVAERLNLVDWALSESRSLIPSGPPKPYPCVVLWSLHARNFVRKGFGATMNMFELLRAYSLYKGCTFVVSEDFAKDWIAWKLGPFWTSTLPKDQWQARFNAAPSCGNLDLAFWSPPPPMKCERAFGLFSQQDKYNFARNPAYNGPGAPTGVFHGSYDLSLQTLGPRLQAYHTPFSEGYVGIHIRHGEKAHEINQLVGISTVVDVLKKYWPHMKNVFLASDDSQVVTDAEKKLGSGYTVRTTADEQRRKGGTPESGINNHVHDDDDAVNAVLDDISGLASASVMIGTLSSNFFSTAHTLNEHLHRQLKRQEPWCFDAHSATLCG